MAELGLDMADVRIVIEHPGGRRVAERMAASSVADVGGANVVTDELRHAVLRDLAALDRQEQHVRILELRGRPVVLDVLLDDRDSLLEDGDDAVLVPFASAHGHDSALLVDGVQAQLTDLRAPQPRRVQHVEDGEVADAGRAVELDSVEHLEDLVGVHHAVRQRTAELREFEVGGGVARRCARPRHEREVRAQRHEASVLRVRAQPISVGLDQLVQVTLVRLEMGVGDDRGLGQPLLGRPRHEQPQVALVVRRAGLLVSTFRQFSARSGRSTPRLLTDRLPSADGEHAEAVAVDLPAHQHAASTVAARPSRSRPRRPRHITATDGEKRVGCDSKVPWPSTLATFVEV